MNKVDHILENLDNRYLALTKTDVTISKREVNEIRAELKSLREENSRLNHRLTMYEVSSSDDKLTWR